MAIALAGNTSFLGVTTNPVTTSSFTSAGNLIVGFFVDASGSPSTLAVTDNKGNSYTVATFFTVSVGDKVSYFYAQNATTGAGHTLTFTTDASKTPTTAIVIDWFSGTATSPFDQAAGATGGSGVASIAPGTLTPSVANCLVWTFGYDIVSPFAAGTWSAGTGIDSVNIIGSRSGVSAYTLQTSAVATNPTFSTNSAGNSGIRAQQYIFKPPSGGGSVSGDDDTFALQPSGFYARAEPVITVFM